MSAKRISLSLATLCAAALLAELRDQQLQGELTTRAAARQWARQRIARNRPAAP